MRLKWIVMPATVWLVGTAGCVLDALPSGSVLSVDAGPDLFAVDDETLTLSATAAGGMPPYVFRWNVEVVPAGSIEELADPVGQDVETLPFVVGRYVYRVVVTDAAGETAWEFVSIEVGPVPLAVTVSEAPADGSSLQVTAAEPFGVTAEPSLEGEYSFLWSHVSGVAVEFSDETLDAPLVTAMEAGPGRIRVTITEDETGRTADAEIAFNAVQGEAFLVETDRPVFLILDEGRTLTASVSNDTMDPARLSYSWEVTNGAAAVFSAADASVTQITGTALETVAVRVTVTLDTDDGARAETDEFSLVVLESERPRLVTSVESDDGSITGEIVFELFADAAPRTVANLVQYVDESFYADLLWHRVPGDPAVVQGGGFFRNDEGFLELKEPTRDPIGNESDNGLSNTAGTLAMALQAGDADSARTQFFVNTDDNTFLDDQRFTVFGELVSGDEVIDAMSQVETDLGDLDGGGVLFDVPVSDLRIVSFTRDPS